MARQNITKRLSVSNTIYNRANAYSKITAELDQQAHLKLHKKFLHTPLDAGMTDEYFMLTLMEEVGECAKALQENDYAGFLEELTQVAALATARMIFIEENKLHVRTD